LSALTFSEASVTGGDASEIDLSLSHPAPSGGLNIMLSSSEPDVLEIPSSVQLAEGESSLSFPISTHSVSASVSVAVRAQLGSSVAGASLSVLPSSSASFNVSLPASITVQQGKAGSATVTTKVNSGFDEALNLKASGEPAGVTLGLSPKTIPAPGSGTSKLSVRVAIREQTGSYPLTITASEGSSSASAKSTLRVISGTTDPDATFKGCWYKQGGHSYQAVNVSAANQGTYPFNAVLYYGSSCNPDDYADQFGYGELINFGASEYTFWFTAFADQTEMSALWYVGDQSSQCVSYLTAPDC
jgi:hypothetical protein